jgi:hypothetical protein
MSTPASRNRADHACKEAHQMHAKLRTKYQRSGKQQVEKHFECEGPTRDQHWKVIATIVCR